jgi:hypothetical protein
MRNRLLLCVLATTAALIGISPVSHAQQSDTQIIRVYHQAVNPVAVSGSGVGTVRTFFIPMAVNGRAADNQYLAGTLTTLAENAQGELELRASNLTFVFGQEADQIVVGGISLYPPTAATLAPGARTVRPVIGGSGEFFGARGQVTSTNLGAAGWTHVFRIRIA